MKFMLAAFVIMSFLGCASTNSTTSAVNDPMIDLDKGLNTLLDQIKKPEMNPSSIKLTTDLLSFAASAKSSGPSNTKSLSEDERKEVQKEFEEKMVFIEKDLQGLMGSLKENDNQLAKEYVSRAAQTIKLMSGSAVEGD